MLTFSSAKSSGAFPLPLLVPAPVNPNRCTNSLKGGGGSRRRERGGGEKGVTECHQSDVCRLGRLHHDSTPAHETATHYAKARHHCPEGRTGRPHSPTSSMRAPLGRQLDIHDAHLAHLVFGLSHGKHTTFHRARGVNVYEQYQQSRGNCGNQRCGFSLAIPTIGYCTHEYLLALERF